MPLQNAIDVPTNAINPKITNIPNFNVIPIMSASTGGTAAVTVNTFNCWALPTFGAYFECYNSIAATNIAPAMAATAGNGINIDNITGAVSKTIELSEGNNTQCKNLYVSRTSAIFIQASFNVNTLANVTDLFIGFRKQQTYTATLSSYTDFATIGVHSTSGHIQSQTNLASGGVVTTDSTNTITAGTTFTVRVNVDASGNVTYLLNGAAPTTVVAYQFGAALNLIPFILYSTPAGGHTEVDLISYSCGLQ